MKQQQQQPRGGVIIQLIQLGDCNAVLLKRKHGQQVGGGHAAGRPGPFHTDEEPLCAVHRPTAPAEAERLREAGAEVSATGRLGGLAVSRCLGDRMLKEERPIALLAVPEVTTIVIEEAVEVEEEVEAAEPVVLAVDVDDNAASNAAAAANADPNVSDGSDELGPLLVLSCDGLFDFLKPQEVCAVVNRALAPSCSSTEDATSNATGKATASSKSGALETAARALADAALDRGDDNVSIVVVDLGSCQSS